eukprot:m.297682 g.297682  ORF g.297682 m.297682 type:complete len:55 (+) comp273205_c0_seq1:77-241(+)
MRYTLADTHTHAYECSHAHTSVCTSLTAVSLTVQLFAFDFLFLLVRWLVGWLIS